MPVDNKTLANILKLADEKPIPKEDFRALLKDRDAMKELAARLRLKSVFGGGGADESLLSELVALATQEAETFYKSADCSANAISELISLTDTNWSYEKPAVPSEALCKNGDDAKSIDLGPQGESVCEVVGDTIWFRCPVEKMPYGVGLVCVYDDRNDQRLVAIRPIVALESAGYRRADIALSGLGITELKPGYVACVIPATDSFAGLFDRTAVKSLSENCRRPELKKQIDEFLEIIDRQLGQRGENQ